MVAAALVVASATLAWELGCRAVGYGPTLNDTADLWADSREAVKPDSVIIIGDSRAWFDLDLDELERGYGQRPIQLALAGSCAYPMLEHFADDTSFRGTVICSFVPGMYFAPGGPLVKRSQEAIERYRKRTPAQRWGHRLSMLLEERLAFLKEGEIRLGDLVRKVPVPNRAGVRLPPEYPPYFNSIERDRRARMIAEAAQPTPLRDHIRRVWLPLFTPPPPPPNVSKEQFMANMGKAVEKRFADTTAAVNKIRARGGNVIFVRFPFAGDLKKLEDQLTPREKFWEPLLQTTGVAGIHVEDHADLAAFDCPEWSHLNAEDSVEFTRRLIPHLQRAGGSKVAASASAPATLAK